MTLGTAFAGTALLILLGVMISVAEIVLIIYLLVAVGKLKKKGRDHSYAMYIGLNGKDTNAPKYTMEEATKLAVGICSKYLKGYNIKKSSGVWVSDDKKIFNEDSIVVTFNFIEDKNVHIMANEIIKAFNQECVFIEDYRIKAEFYYGEK